MSLHLDGQIVALCCKNKKVRIWAAPTHCLYFNGNGNYLGCRDVVGTVLVWALRKIKALRFSPSGRK